MAFQMKALVLGAVIFSLSTFHVDAFPTVPHNASLEARGEATPRGFSSIAQSIGKAVCEGLDGNENRYLYVSVLLIPTV
jgi:hypothetical protein